MYLIIFEKGDSMNSIEELKNKIQTAYNNWETNVYNKSANKSPEREKEFTTASFTKVEPLYYPIKGDENYLEDIGFPGEFPLQEAFSQLCTGEDFGQ